MSSREEYNRFTLLEMAARMTPRQARAALILGDILKACRWTDEVMAVLLERAGEEGPPIDAPVAPPNAELAASRLDGIALETAWDGKHLYLKLPSAAGQGIDKARAEQKRQEAEPARRGRKRAV